MSEQVKAKKVPAYAAKELEPREGVSFLMRPRALSLGWLVFFGAVFLALIVFSAVVDSGFIRLASIPAIPLLAGIAAHLVHAPVILVTDRRIVIARRFLKPAAIDLRKIEAMQVKQNAPGRLFGFGALILLIHPPRDAGEGVFLQVPLKKLPDPAGLGDAIAAAARALKG